MQLIDHLEIHVDKPNELYQALMVAGIERNKPFDAILDARGILPNGPGWEFVFIKLVDKAQPELFDSCDFDPEADACYLYFDEEEHLNAFVEIVKEEFPDIESFESFVATLDPAECEA